MNSQVCDYMGATFNGCVSDLLLSPKKKIYNSYSTNKSSAEIHILLPRKCKLLHKNTNWVTRSVETQKHSRRQATSKQIHHNYHALSEGLVSVLAYYSKGPWFTSNIKTNKQKQIYQPSLESRD